MPPVIRLRSFSRKGGRRRSRSLCPSLLQYRAPPSRAATTAMLPSPLLEGGEGGGGPRPRLEGFGPSARAHLQPVALDLLRPSHGGGRLCTGAREQSRERWAAAKRGGGGTTCRSAAEGVAVGLGDARQSLRCYRAGHAAGLACGCRRCVGKTLCVGAALGPRASLQGVIPGKPLPHGWLCVPAVHFESYIVL